MADDGIQNAQDVRLVDGLVGTNVQAVNADNEALVLATLDPAASHRVIITDADADDALVTADGELHTFPVRASSAPVSGTIADDTKTTIVAAPGASLITCVTSITVYQTGAVEATVNVYDGTTIIWRIPLAADFGAGIDKDMGTPWILTANTLLALEATVSTSYAWSVQTCTIAG